jgi:hypothetical protein
MAAETKRQKTNRRSSEQVEDERFVGDLNPEVELLSASAPARAPKNSVGLWHCDAGPSDPPGSAADQDFFSSMSLFHGLSTTAEQALLPILEIQTRVCPSEIHMQALEVFYFENIDPVLPAIDHVDYASSPSNSPSRILQRQIICLVASANEAVKDHLRLPGEANTPLAPSEFSRKVLDSMRLTIELGIVTRKSLIVRALAIMSITSYGRENLELASQLFPRAVHLGYTIGLHQPRDAVRDKKVASLFCLVWVIDRIHAATLGRPVLMHEVDMGKYAGDCVRDQTPGFQVFVTVAILLDSVIALYRPNASATEIADSDFLLFDEILLACSATNLPPRLLATLELFYQ